MNLLYCGDANIADGVLLSVMSVLENTHEPLNIYILTLRLKTDSKTFYPLNENFRAFLEAYVNKFNSKSCVSLIDVTENFNNDIPLANIETRFTPYCMLRLYADELPLPDRILYLDSDVICRKSFDEFYYQDIKGVELVGVTDYYGKWFFKNHPLHFDYLNSGVLLLNLDEIRKTGLFKKCRERCRYTKMFMPDQSAINKLSVSKRIADRKYNEQRKLKNDTVFQHFTTSFRFFPYIRTVSVKPWQTERMHNVLKLHEYDDLLEKYNELKSNIYKPLTEEMK